MDREFGFKRFALWFLSFSVVYVLLYLYGDLYVSEFAKNVIGLDSSSTLKFYNVLCSFKVFEVLTFILVILYLVTRKYRFSRAALCIAVTLLFAGLLGDNLKWILGRARPPAYFDNGVYGMQWFQSKDLFHSTPSGHSTRAMALAGSLLFFCKSTWQKYVLIIFALTQALCRVVLLRHYLSDVIFGLWLGLFVAIYVHSVMYAKNNSL